MLGAEGQAGQHVGAEVDRQHLEGSEGNQADPAQRGEDEREGSAMLREKM